MTALIEYLTVLLECIDLFGPTSRVEPRAKCPSHPPPTIGGASARLRLAWVSNKPADRRLLIFTHHNKQSRDQHLHILKNVHQVTGGAPAPGAPVVGMPLSEQKNHIKYVSYTKFLQTHLPITYVHVVLKVVYFLP